MSLVKLELNSDGIRQLLRSDEMAALVGELAEVGRARCGDGYESDTHLTPSRVVASVYTGTVEAKQDNLEHNTILKAVMG